MEAGTFYGRPFPITANDLDFSDMTGFLSTVIAVLFLGIAHQSFGADFLQEKGWLAFGEHRGSYEPCGCNPKTDLGGMQRLGVFLQRERAINGSFLTFALGNSFSDKPSSWSYKDEMILAALEELNISAALLNQNEITQAIHSKMPLSKLNFVLTNTTSPNLKKIAAAHVAKEGAHILGFVEPWNKAMSKSLTNTDAFIKQARTVLEKAKASAKVLLFSGNDHALKKIHAAKLFDLIISSNPRPMSTPLTQIEKENPKSLFRLHGAVTIAPLGGQGVLRGGRLLESRAKSVAEILSPSEPAPMTDPFISPKNGNSSQDWETPFVTWLDTSYDVEGPLKKIDERYEQLAKDDFLKRRKARVNDLAKSPFAGAEKCKTCHAADYEIWQNSGHAHALATLEKRGKAEDPECVSCHVLGYSDFGGFVSKTDSPQFINVQCENCHGPRADHALNPTKKTKPSMRAKDACTSCHFGMHTPDFVFETYWKKILHGSKLK